MDQMSASAEGVVCLSTPVGLPAPTAISPPISPFTCIRGFVDLFQLGVPAGLGGFPAPMASVLGRVISPAGFVVPIVQTQPVPFGVPLSTAQRQFVTLCGVFRLAAGIGVVFDVSFVAPAVGGAPFGGSPFSPSETGEVLVFPQPLVIDVDP